MEPTVPIVIVDGGVGGLCQQRLLSMEALVGWIQWWPCPALMAPTQRSLASQFLLTTVIINGGDGGMEPTAPIIVIDHNNGGHCWLQQQLLVVAAMAVFVDNGCR